MICHECTCFLSAPCGACENCVHPDYPECENDCQECEDHFCAWCDVELTDDEFDLCDDCMLEEQAAADAYDLMYDEGE